MSSTMKTLSLFASGVAIYYTSKYIYNFFYSKPKCALPKLASEELLREELKRNYEFFNEEGMKLIRDSFVIIVGLDSIGSNVALTLVRSGVKKIRIIDNSILSENDYQDHPFAVSKDVNKYNVDIVEEYSRNVNPNIEIEKIKEKFDIKKGEKMLLDGEPNYIIDCISNDLDSKCELLKYASEHKMKVISAMNPVKGIFDPTKVRMSQFCLVHNDETAKKLNELYQKKYNEAVPNNLTVYSSEKVNENYSGSSLVSIKAIISQTITSKLLCELANFNTQQQSEKESNENKDKPKEENNKEEKKVELKEDKKKDEPKNNTEKKPNQHKKQRKKKKNNNGDKKQENSNTIEVEVKNDNVNFKKEEKKEVES